jgi:hypothetical protein
MNRNAIAHGFTRLFEDVRPMHKALSVQPFLVAKTGWLHMFGAATPEIYYVAPNMAIQIVMPLPQQMPASCCGSPG